MTENVFTDYEKRAQQIAYRLGNIANREDINLLRATQERDILALANEAHAAGRREAIAEVVPVLEKMLPIVEEAYWDHQTAWNLPGAGYSNKAQSLAGKTFNAKFQDASYFKEWVKQARALLERLKENK